MIDNRPIQAVTNRQLHALLTVNNLMAHKSDLVNTFTDGRTQHSSEMMEYEATELVQHLRQLEKTKPATDGCDVMRKKILAICHTHGWYQRHADSKLVMKDGRPVLDMARINAFCMQRGPFKKPLQLHTEKELPLLITIFEKL